MDARRTTLGSADMQTASIELDLMPLETAHFRGSEAVTIGDQDHRCIAMAMPIALGSFDQALDLALGQIAALDCEVFDSWRVAIGYLIYHGKSLSCKDDLKDNSLF